MAEQWLMMDFSDGQGYTLQTKKRMTNQARRHKVEAPRRRTAAGSAGAPGAGTDMVRLNTRAIRRKALKDYRQAEQKLEGLKEQLQRYKEHDVPGFRAWMHRACGRLLTRERELLGAIEEKNALLLEVEEWAHVHGLPVTAAYRKVLWRRAHPQEAEEEDRQMAEKAAQSKGLGQDAGMEDEDWDDPFSGDDFDASGDAWDAFAEMVERMTGIRPPPRAGGKERRAETPDQKSAKELYRRIVRRLHPDHHGQMNEARKNLWHEAQQAYRTHDVNALYNILARCEGGEAGIGDHSPVSLIRHLVLQFRKTTRSVGQEVRRAKTDLAWDFENKIRDPRFVHRIQLDLKDAIHEAEWHLHSLEETLARLDHAAAHPNRPRNNGRRQQTPPRNLEFDLPF
jgi:hypothetical protein